MNSFALPLVFLTAIATSSPEQVVRDFYAALGSGDQQRALALLSPTAAPDARDEIAALGRLRCLDISSLHVLGVEEGGGRATVDVVAATARTQRAIERRVEELEHRRFDLRLEDAAWRIVAMPTAEQEIVERIRVNPAAANELLRVHAALLGPPLVSRILDAATSGSGRDFAQVDRPIVDLAYEIAVSIGDRAGEAEAAAAKIRNAITGTDSSTLIPRAEDAFRLAEASGSPRAIAASGNTLAVLHLRKDPTSREAERIHRRILDLRDALAPNRVAHILTNMGTSRIARQDYPGAYQMLVEALGLTTEPATIALAEQWIGRILEVQNEPQLALEHFRRATQVSSPKPYEAQARFGLARVHRTLGQRAEAWAQLERVMEIARGTPLKGLISEYYTMRAELQIDQGDTAAAEESLQKALAYAREIRIGMLEIGALLTLGAMYYDNRRLAEALRAAREAEAVWTKFDFPGYHRYYALMLAARSEMALGHEEQAMDDFAEAVAAVESVRGEVAGGERMRARFFEPYHAAYTEMVALLLARGRVAEALVYAERGKGRVLLDVLGQERKEAAGLSGEERAARAALLADLGAVNRKLIVLRATEGAAKAEKNKLLEEQRRAQLALDAFDVDLAARHPRLRAAQGDPPIIDPSSLRGISGDLAFVEFVVHDRATFAFVVGRDAVTSYRIDVTRVALRERVGAFGRQLAARDLDYQLSGRSLYDLLFAPAAPRLKGKRVVCVVPDDALWSLPFEALTAPDGHFVIERFALFYAPSISTHREIVRAGRGRSRSKSGLVAFGNPLLTGGAHERPAPLKRSIELGPLPDAEREVRQIGRLYGRKSKVYIGAEAREERAKRDMTRARIVHFATHGLFDDRNPMFSQLVLTAGGGEDGVLQAWEMMRLDLQADLVVLSACDTARGAVGAGEGLIGMSWALFVGGCPSTVATLWRVDSRSAARLMIAFHRQLVRGAGASRAPKAEALRVAQLELLRDADTRHPFYWAGFVLIGSGS